MRTLLQISDLHFGTVDERIAAGLIEDIAGQKCDLLVISGDFTQRARAEQYQAAAELRRHLPQPQLVVPGNHDIPLFDVRRRFFSPLHNYHRYITTEMLPQYIDDEVAVLGVNTARPWNWTMKGFWKDGRISDGQLLEIRQRLGEAVEGRVKLLVTHHPFIPPPVRRYGVLLGAERALAQLQSVGIDLLLAGHLHVSYSGDVRAFYPLIRNSMISIQAGTATSTRLRGEPNAYNVIGIEGDHVTITVRSWNGERFATSHVTEYRRTELGWEMVAASAAK